MGTTSTEVLVTLDRSRPRSLRSQLEDELRDAIRAGRLAPGAALPSTRALATDLGVTRGVVVEAYDQLAAEGYLVARRGSATRVNRSTPSPARDAAPAPSAARIDVDFRPGWPDVSSFPRAGWARAARTAIHRLPDADLGYGNPSGLPVLREALVDHLARVRGVCAEPDQVVVCSGFGHGFDLLARTLGDVFAIEDPGYDAPRAQLAALGMRRRAVPVDADGIDVARLRRSGARAAVVTPAHQSPTGVVLSSDRRRQLIEWARAVDGLVVEDDYDAEYRYDRRPVGALQGVEPDRVVYAGTASKSLAPALRLGWLVAPPAVAEAITAQRQLVGSAPPALLQATFAAFLANGDLDRHLRRMRRVYRERRDAVVDALARWLPEATPSGIAAGLHVLVTLPDGVDEDGVVARALEAGVLVRPLAEYRARPSSSPAPALVIGYGRVTPEQAERGIRALAGALTP